MVNGYFFTLAHHVWLVQHGVVLRKGWSRWKGKGEGRLCSKNWNFLLCFLSYSLSKLLFEKIILIWKFMMSALGWSLTHVYAHTLARMYTHMVTRTHTCTHTRRYAHTHAHMHAHTYARTHCGEVKNDHLLARGWVKVWLPPQRQISAFPIFHCLLKNSIHQKLFVWLIGLLVISPPASLQ